MTRNQWVEFFTFVPPLRVVGLLAASALQFCRLRTDHYDFRRPLVALNAVEGDLPVSDGAAIV